MKQPLTINKHDARQAAARGLAEGEARVRASKAFVGLDGFVDEIVHVVDIRQGADKYTRLPTMTMFAERIAEAAGKSTNIEMVNQQVKLGGNGPILANTLASLGMDVTYVGALGKPNIHAVFEPLTKRANVASIADPGHTQALEFEDGKLMLVKSVSLNDVTWENIEKHFGREPFRQAFAESDLVAFVNWTMIPQMTRLWRQCIAEFGPALTGPKRMMFFDLADPEKRPKKDLVEALGLMREFGKWFHVTLGLNEKEAVEVAEALGIRGRSESQAELVEMTRELYAKLGLSYLVVHPVPYAFVVHESGVDAAYGPEITKALITTGAGDHFNGGFCLGKLLNLPPGQCISLAVAASGFYVKNGATPSLLDLISFLEEYPVADAEEAA